MLERKTFAAEYKVDSRQRIIEGYASTFGNVDLGDDVVMPGAFTKTLATEFPARRIKVMRDHEHLIGLPLHMEQDTGGLFTREKISATPIGEETIVLAADGVIDRKSIGYLTEQKSYGMQDGRKVRRLESLRLKEYSLLAFPMNPAAVITSVKSADDLEAAFAQVAAALDHLREFPATRAEYAAKCATLAAELTALSALATGEPESTPASPSAPVAVSAPAPADVSAELASLLGDFRSFLAAVR